MSYDLDKLARLQALNDLAQRIKAKFDALQAADVSLKSVTVDGNALKFFTTTDTTTTPAFTIDLPAEMFLDNLSTGLVANFTFSAATYAGATDPNLNGKPVMVLGVKTRNNDGVTETTSYSFLDMSALVDVYVASDTSIVITDYKIKANVSADSDNMLATTANGLKVDGSGKVDKVAGTVGNVVEFAANGAVSDTGIASTDVIVKDANATASNIPAYTADGKFTDTGIASADVLTKISTATDGNLVVFSSGGAISDTGISIATNAEVTEMLDSIFGSANVSVSFSSTSDFFSTNTTTFKSFLQSAYNALTTDSATKNTLTALNFEVTDGTLDNDGDPNTGIADITYGDLYTLLQKDGATVQDFANLLNDKIQADGSVGVTVDYDETKGLTFTNNSSAIDTNVNVTVNEGGNGGTSGAGHIILESLYNGASDKTNFTTEQNDEDGAPYTSYTLELTSA